MKINGQKYLDESQLAEELEKLKSGSINQIQLVRSVQQNAYMQVEASADFYTLSFVKGDENNYVYLAKQDFDNISAALLSYCNKDGRYKKMFRWEKGIAAYTAAPASGQAAAEYVDYDAGGEPKKMLSPLECFTTTLSKNYCNFSGRASRRTYWFYVLFSALLGVLFFIINVIIIVAVASSGDSDAVGAVAFFLDLIGWIISLAFFLPNLSLWVRRLHDTDKSGWFVLLGLIPCAGPIICLVFALEAGTPGENHYGPPEN